MDKIYEKIKELIVECGKLLLNVDYDNIDIQNKEGINNLVTGYDFLIQNKLKEELLKLIPDAGFIGEEEDCNNNINNKYVFIVDPIDGTVNFARNIKLSAISIALLKDGFPIFGVCYYPYTNDLYEAIKDNGAFLNGKKISVSNRKLKDGILLCGCAPYFGDLREKSLTIQKKFAMVASDYRRFGSAVIEICSIANGGAELYFELKLMPWDYAAASLILEEAGGKITTMDGKNIQYFEPTSIIASNGVEDYLKYIK